MATLPWMRAPGKMTYRDPEPNVYAEAEARVARIRESEETKRALNKEREETKRAKVKARSQWWAAHGTTALVVFGVSGLMVLFVGGFIYKDVRHRTDPQSCEESSEIVSSSDSRFSCPGGGWLEVVEIPEVIGSHFRMTCHCGPHPAASH